MTLQDLKPAFGAATLPITPVAQLGEQLQLQSVAGSSPAWTTIPARIVRRLGLQLGASFLALALSGCGMSQLERHTTTAGALHAATGLAAQVIDAGAQEAADAATSPADLAARMEPWRRAEAAQHLAAEASDAYLEEVLAMALAAATGESDDTRALRALSHAMGAYRALADLLATYGVELPGVARVLAAVGGAL